MKTDYPKLRAHLRSLKTQAAQETFARQCGTSLSYLRKAMSKGARIDVALVEKLVVNSRFTVPPEELRDDVDWSVFALEHSGRSIVPDGAAPRRRSSPAVARAA